MKVEARTIDFWLNGMEIIFEIKRMKSKIILFAMIIVLGMTADLVSQVNSHYWSHQYGSKGLLLNGSIIASVNDETAIFYNPGSMAMSDNFGISLSLVTPTYSLFKTTNFLGENTSFSDSGLGLAPGLVSAMFKPFGTDKITMGITTFSRFRSDVNVEDRVINLVQSNDSQLFLGDVGFERRLSETWVGIGLSIRLHPRLAIGATQFFTFRSENVSLNFRKDILERDNPANLVTGWRSNFEYGYSANGGALTKFGICWQPGGIKFGATYTTSTYALISRGADYAFDDQKLFVDGSASASSNDRSVDLAEFKTPWSAGVGVELPIGKNKISISVEHFTKVDGYTLIDDTDDPLNGLSSDPETTTVTIGQENEEVVNIGIGIERPWNKKFTWLFGFRTDFSPQSIVDLGEGISFLAATPDIFHVSTGGSYSYRKSQFSIGVDYGFGVKTGGQQLTDLSKITTENIFNFNGDESVRTSIHQFSLYVTYDL